MSNHQHPAKPTARNKEATKSHNWVLKYRNTTPFAYKICSNPGCGIEDSGFRRNFPDEPWVATVTHLCGQPEPAQIELIPIP